MTMLLEIKAESRRPAGGAAASDSGSPGRSQAIIDSEWLQLAATIGLYCFQALLFIRVFYIVDPDIWWHLRTGQWILQHGTIPATDPFSTYGADKPWTAYSWLFDSAMATLFGRFGLTAVVSYQVAVHVALTAALFHTLRNLMGTFWRPAALTAAAILPMSRVIGPRPGMLTILLVIVLLDILLSVERSGRTRLLWFLPPLFVLWANWHIQFVYGLCVLGVFAAEPLANSLLGYKPRVVTKLSPKAAWFTLALSALATLANPYGARIYSTVFLYAGQSRMYNYISEFLAMSFRQPEHYLVLLLAMGAAFCIGWRRDARPLWMILLLAAAILAFRSVRELWFLTVISACVIADGWPQMPRESGRGARSSWRANALVGLWVLALLFAASRHYGISNDALSVQTAGTFPEAAASYIDRNHVSGPLFNDLSWGGYLIWRLPTLPVALDGRTNVYGEDRILRFSDVWKGKPGWESDPDLNRASVVLTPRDAAIASLLRTSPRFRVAYEDSQALVFQRR